MKLGMRFIIFVGTFGCMLLAMVIHMFDKGYASYAGAAMYGFVVGFTISIIVTLTYRSWYKHRFF